VNPSCGWIVPKRPALGKQDFAQEHTEGRENFIGFCTP
jgi:hypothetical protein